MPLKFPLSSPPTTAGAVIPMTHHSEFNSSSHGRQTRYKLWELQNCWHCMVVGTCLSLAEVRQLAHKAGISITQKSDYDIHQLAVESASNNKHPLSQRLQKQLERKFAVSIKQFRAAKDEETLHDLWTNGWKSGQVAGSLWALISHPLATRALIMKVFGQVHMMSHLSGASTCVDRERLLKQERQIDMLNEELQTVKKRYQQASNSLSEQSRQLNSEREKYQKLQAHTRLLDTQQRQGNVTASKHIAAQPRIEQLQSQLTILQETVNDERAINQQLLEDIEQLEQLLKSSLIQASNEELDTPNTCNTAPSTKALKLCGQCVLYLGGKTQQRRHFQALVESHEGRFLHHDGGLETCPHRITELVSQADVVMCPTDCISHSAMQKARALCAKQEKPMIFMQRSSLSAFTRSLQENLS